MRPSTRKPDLDNANVGNIKLLWESAYAGSFLFGRYLRESECMIKINGESKPFEDKSIAEILEELGYSSQRVAVELNENIVPKARYAETFVKDGDSVEVVRFVGGG